MTTAKELAEKISDIIWALPLGTTYYQAKEYLMKELESLLQAEFTERERQHTEALAEAQKQIIDGYSETKFIKEAKAAEAARVRYETYEDAAQIAESGFPMNTQQMDVIAENIRRRAKELK